MKVTTWFRPLLVLALISAFVSVSVQATIYDEYICDGTSDYNGPHGAGGGDFSASSGVCNYFLKSGQEYHLNLSDPGTGIVILDIVNYNNTQTSTAGGNFGDNIWFSYRNTTIDGYIGGAPWYGITGFSRQATETTYQVAGFVYGTGNNIAFAHTAFVQYNVSLRIDYDNDVAGVLINGVQNGANFSLEDDNPGKMLTIGTDYEGVPAGHVGWTKICLRDESSSFGCPAEAAGPTLNISLFAPSQDKHYNTDLVAVFNTTGVSNGTCELVVGGFVRDMISDVNSTSSNYTMTWTGVTEGNNSWFVECFDSASSISTTPDSVLTVTGVQEGNATNLSVQDGNSLLINEVTGAPGFEVRMNWTLQLDSPIGGNFFLDYDGHPSHEITIQGWNSTGWEGQGNFSDEGGFFWLNFTGTAPTDRFVVDNQVSVRLFHDASGNQNHDLFVDYAALLFVDEDTTIQSETWYYYVDLTNPLIDSVAPFSGENINTVLYSLDIKYSDLFVSETETNITCGTTNIFYNKTTELAESFNVTNTTSFGNIESSCLAQERVADDHTSILIADYNPSINKDNVLFNTDKGASIRVTSLDATKTFSARIVDRYNFGYEYLTSSPSRSYAVSSSWPITVNNLRSYPAFVAYDPAGFGGHWVDFKNPNIKSWEVEQTGINSYDVSITFDRSVSDVTFQSVGGLNVAEQNVTFNVDTLNPRVWTGPRVNVSTTDNVTQSFSVNITDASLSTGNFYTNETGAWSIKRTWTATNGTQEDFDYSFSKGGLVKWGVCATDNFSNTGCDDNFTIFLNVSIPVLTINYPPINYSSFRNSVTLSVTVTQSVPMPDTLTFFVTETDGTVLQSVSTLNWSDGESHEFDLRALPLGVVTYQFSANDTLGIVVFSENRTINITRANYSGIFSGSNCPTDSLESILMFAFMFLLLLSIYVVAFMVKLMYWVEFVIGLAFILFSFTVINCNMWIGFALILFGFGIMFNSVRDANK